MDIRSRFDLGGLQRRFSQGISGLRKDAPRAKRFFVAFAFILSAGMLAWGAQELTYSQALLDWEHQRIPSSKTWAHALGSRGLTSPTAPDIIHKTLRKLPTTLDTAGSAWASPDFGWVVIFENPNQPVPQKLYCRDCQHPPDRFESIGAGWSAFDQILDRMDRAAPRVPAAAKVKKAKFVDPRELQF